MDAPIPDLDDDQAFAEALRPSLLRLSRQLRREAQKAGMSALDATLLALIQKRPGIGGGELADFERMTRPSMSSHLKRLESAGWIREETVICLPLRCLGQALHDVKLIGPAAG